MASEPPSDEEHHFVVLDFNLVNVKRRQWWLKEQEEKFEERATSKRVMEFPRSGSGRVMARSQSLFQRLWTISFRTILLKSPLTSSSVSRFTFF
jgi:hypothetical protein